MKIIALTLGPDGVGLFGLLTALQEIGGQVADGGLAHAGTRAVARERDSPERAGRIRRAWCAGALVAAALGGGIVWLFPETIARLLSGDASVTPAVVIIALGVALTVIVRWRQGLTAAYGKSIALAHLQVAGTGLSVLATTALVTGLGFQGLAWAVISLPAATLAMAILVRLPRLPCSGRPSLSELRPLLRAGLGLMAVAIVALVAPMAVRIWLTHEAGLAAAGHFQAAWTVWAQTSAIALHALTIDFYPRMSRLAHDDRAADTALTGQIGLLLRTAAPVLIVIITLAEPLLTLLYDTPFSIAAPMLQVVLIGGIVRLAAAPVECTLAAGGHVRDVLCASLIAVATFVLGSWLLWPSLGLTGVGAACALSHAIQFIVLSSALSSRRGIRIGTRNMILLATGVSAALLAAGLPGMVGLLTAGAIYAVIFAVGRACQSTPDWRPHVQSSRMKT